MTRNKIRRILAALLAALLLLSLLTACGAAGRDEEEDEEEEISLRHSRSSRTQREDRDEEENAGKEDEDGEEETGSSRRSRREEETPTPAPAATEHVHQWSDWEVTQAAGCETAGTESRSCTECREAAEVREIPAVGHSWGPWVVQTEATPSAPGTEIRVCQNDASHTESREIPWTGGALSLTPYSGSSAGFGKLSFSWAQASTECVYHSGSTYEEFPASSAIDGALGTCWQEDADGHGEGEWIEAHFASAQTVSLLCIRPGFARSAALFANNEKPKAVTISFSDGSSADFSFEKSNKDVWIQLSYPVTTEWIRLTIVSTYDSRFDGCCITEIAAYGAGGAAESQSQDVTAVVGDWYAYKKETVDSGGQSYELYAASNLELKADGSAVLLWYRPNSDEIISFSGTWRAKNQGGNEYMVTLNVSGGYADSGETVSRTPVLLVQIKNGRMIPWLYSGDILDLLFWGQSYEKNLSFSTWQANNP